jgi:hypothetical protein
MATVNFGDPEYCTLSGTPPVAKCTSVENAVSAAFGPESNYQSPGKAVAMDDAGNAYFAGGGSFSAGSPVVVAIRCPAGVVASSAPCSADTIAVTSTFGGVPSLAFDSATASAALYGLASPGLISFPAGKPPGSVHAPGSAVWAGPIAITPDY